MIQRCPVCNGTGKASSEPTSSYIEYSNCETCNGVGSYEDVDPGRPPRYMVLFTSGSGQFLRVFGIYNTLNEATKNQDLMIDSGNYDTDVTSSFIMKIEG